MKSRQPTILAILVLFIFISLNAFSQPFITTWKTDNNGSSDSTSITIPTYPNETYNYDVDWDNDGVFDEFGITGDVTHDFGIAGTYTIAIQGVFPRIYFNDSLDKEKILQINQWGSNVWTSMEKAFYGCKNLVGQATDIPNFSMVMDMSYMFAKAHDFDQPVDLWNVSNVTNMSYMFLETPFNQPLNAWNVSNVTNMSYMFAYTFFNQPLNAWDVGNVTNMSYMFHGATFFNQDISLWNVSNVTDMSWMLSTLPLTTMSFNQPLNTWDVSNVTNMRGMFLNALPFNQDISSWNVSNVTDMSGMFRSTWFNQDISSWDVSNVTDMSGMFTFAYFFNQPLNTWNVSNVTDMTYMLSDAGLSVENYDNTLIGWESQGIMNKTLGADSLRFCVSDSIRNNLINLNGWTIIGDTIDDISCKTVSTTSLNTFEIFEIYPNPTNGRFYINAEFEKPLSNVQIEIINTNGQIVQKVDLGNSIDFIQETINLLSFPKGSYYVQIRSDEVQMGKMIILN